MSKVEVLHFLPALDKSGVATMIRTFYEHMDKDEILFHFVHTGETEDYHEELKSRGSKIFYLEPLSKVGFIQYKKNINKILDQLPNVTVAHIHVNYLSGLVAMIVKRRVKTRFIHIRGTLMGNRQKHFKKFASFLMKRYGTDFFAVSEYAGKFYFGKKSFQVIKNAVDIEKFQNVDANDIAYLEKEFDLKNQYIAHIGRLAEEKNQKFSIHLIKELKNCGLDYKLLLVGDGPLRCSLEEYSKELGVESSVLFLGIRDDIPELLKISTFSILPSFSEGLPNVVIQSQAAAVTCLISDVITNEVDMGIGLVKFLSLSDIRDWIDCIKNTNVSQIKDYKVAKEAIVAKGFEINSEAKRLKELYYEKNTK